MTLTVGSLFSGIGGIDLGLERAGMTVKWQSEIDPYASQVLKKHWPDIPNLGDIKTVDWSTVEPVDLIAGGYPCQPFSTAGKRQGENDPRHLWPYFRDAISAIRPRYALLENVRGHLSMGASTVIGDLAQIGYDCEWKLVSAASVGAPHRRERIIIVAYPNYAGIGTPESRINFDGSQKSKERQHAQFESCRQCENVADTDSSNSPNGRQCKNVQSQNTSWRNDRNGSGSDIGQVSLGSTRENPSNVADTKKQCCNGRRNGNLFGQSEANWLQSTVGGKGSFGRFTNWQIEPDVGRVADGVPARVDRLRGLGNAVVPQVAEYVGRLILQSRA